MKSLLWFPRVTAQPSEFDASIAIDQDGVILDMNHAARNLVARGNLVSGHVGVRARWAWERLQREMDLRIAGRRTEQMLTIADPTGVRHCVIMAVNQDPKQEEAATIHVRDVVGAVEEQARHAASLFKLTPSEHELAASLLLGRSLDMHAQLRGSAISTVRKQLSAICAKTGTSRQHEMTATLHAISAMPTAIPAKTGIALGDQRRKR